ncbi:hypothetical protein [Phaeodactylibacter xiamenensis]|uniref:hypothetical protein n=1 Tax=Phaeodactylibacter xiamenensis TaxID=1524460 RepID=UPI003BAAB83A
MLLYFPKRLWGNIPIPLILAFLLCGMGLLPAQAPKLPPDLKLHARVNQYDAEHFNLLTNRYSTPLQAGSNPLALPGSAWAIQLDLEPLPGQPDILEGTATFICQSGQTPSASVSIDFEFSDWSTDNYVLMPGAVYNGNRFPYRRIRYSPKLLDPRDIGPNIPTIISDVPKLNVSDGPSRIQQRTGDMTLPAIGFHHPEKQEGLWLLTPPQTRLGDSGIDITENRDRDKATISLTAPVVREQYKYRITDSRWPSDDIPADFTAGDTVQITFQLHLFSASELQGLFDYYTHIRKSYLPAGKHRLILPFSEAFPVQEAKFNRLNWEDEHGYYSVGPRNMFLQDWQIGWTGGMISTLPLLWEGHDTTRQRVLRQFDWLFPDGLAPSGLFWDSGEHGDQWYGGDIRKPHTKNWHLIRKSGDGLYYVLKQLMLMDSLGITPKPNWVAGTQGVADALVKIWDNHGQFGHFVDNPSGEVVVGGSTSGGIIPAALTLAASYFNEPAYLETAEAAGWYYYKNYIQRGLTNGGPGDAMQNPDSESCYALIESYASLYEATGNTEWLKMGEDIARQFATWVIAYDYPFPENSLFGREGMHSIGAVNANTQNKHGAPGICTHSGQALLKLYRATGDAFYAELLQDIARNMPQYLPHPLNPIEGTKEGWMCERVSTTDWLEGIGEISYLTTWSETALMLTYVEIPGLYVQPDRGICIPFDHVEVRSQTETAEALEVVLHNPTEGVATVKVLVENATDRARPLGELALWNTSTTTLKPGESRTLQFKK